MIIEDAEKALDVYKRFLQQKYLLQLIPLYFIVNSFRVTDKHYGVGTTMRLNLGLSHRLISIRRQGQDAIEFRMCPLSAWQQKDTLFNQEYVFSYSHQDVSPTGQTKDLINSIFSTKTIQNKSECKKQPLKFNIENIYNFEEA